MNATKYGKGESDRLCKMKWMGWNVDWRKWDETWTVKFRMKEMRWNMDNECVLKEVR